MLFLVRLTICRRGWWTLRCRGWIIEVTAWCRPHQIRGHSIIYVFIFGWYRLESKTALLIFSFNSEDPIRTNEMFKWFPCTLTWTTTFPFDEVFKVAILVYGSNLFRMTLPWVWTGSRRWRWTITWTLVFSTVTTSGQFSSHIFKFSLVSWRCSS